MSKKRCLYCGKLITNDKTYYNMKCYCDIDCKNNYDKFEEYASKRTGLFGVTFAIMIVMVFVGATLTVVNRQLGVIVSILAALGVFITFLVFPFATPETVKLFGVKKSVLIVRILMLIMIFWFFISMVF